MQGEFNILSQQCMMTSFFIAIKNDIMRFWLSIFIQNWFNTKNTIAVCATNLIYRKDAFVCFVVLECVDFL